MTQKLIITALICLLLYQYYQQKKKDNFLTGTTSADSGNELAQTNQTLITFLRDQLNSDSLAELKTKLGEKNLDELISENEDYETEVDTLTRTKNSLEADLLSQSNAFQSRLREKEREIKKFKEDLASEQKRQQNQSQNLTSEKQQHKGSLERIKLLTEQITNLEKQLTELVQIKEEITELKDKYSKQGQLLDTEQCENNKLEGTNKKLTENITDLTNQLQKSQTKTKKTQQVAQENINLAKQKITDLENQLLNLAKQKIKGKKEAEKLVKDLEVRYDSCLQEIQDNHYKEEEKLEDFIDEVSQQLRIELTEEKMNTEEEIPLKMVKIKEEISELTQQLELATKKNSATETDLNNTVDTLIKGMAELNKELDKE